MHSLVYYLDDLLETVFEVALLFSLLLSALQLLRFVCQKMAASPRFADYQVYLDRIMRLGRLGLTVLFSSLIAGVIALNAYLLLQQQEVLGGTVELLTVTIPLDFWRKTGLALATALVMALVTHWLLRWFEKLLEYGRQKILTFTLLHLETHTVNGLFDALGKLVTNVAWLFALAFSTQFSPVPTPIAASLFVIAKVYLIIDLGRLVVRIVPEIINAIDALSEKFVASIKLDEFYNQLRGLIPLLNRIIEYIIYVQAATFALMQIPWLAEFASYGPLIIRLIGIFFMSRVIVELLQLVVDKAMLNNPDLPDAQRQQRLTYAPLIKSVLRYLCYGSALLIMLSLLNVNIAPILTAVGGIGLIVGLAAQPLLSDLVAGIMILFENLYMVGDDIEVNSARGKVEVIDVRTTHIRGGDGRVHMIRNGQIGTVVNFSRGYSQAVVTLTIPYDADLERLYQVIEETGKELMKINPNVLEPTRVQGIKEFSPTGISVQAVTKTKAACSDQVANEFRLLIKRALDQSSDALTLQLPLPQSYIVNGFHARS